MYRGKYTSPVILTITKPQRDTQLHVNNYFDWSLKKKTLSGCKTTAKINDLNPGPARRIPRISYF